MNEYSNHNQNLNLDPIIVKLTHPEEGEGWTLEQARRHVEEFKLYLYLVKKYPKISLVPTKKIDKVWHRLIEDTQLYPLICEEVFANKAQKLVSNILRILLSPFGISVHAGFMNHFPYFGLRGEQDARNLSTAFARTIALMKQHAPEMKIDFQPSVCDGICGTAVCETNAAYCGNSCGGTLCDTSACDSNSCQYSWRLGSSNAKVICRKTCSIINK